MPRALRNAPFTRRLCRADGLKKSFPFGGGAANIRGQMAALEIKSPWRWVPTLYVAEGLPYALVTSVSLVLYKNLDVPNGTITFWSALLGLPWIFKPLWGPMVDSLHTRRLWAWVTQLVMGAILAGAAAAGIFWRDAGVVLAAGVRLGHA